MEQLGKYGFLRRDYLKNHRNSLYQVMLLQDSIGEHLLEVDKAAREREEMILKQLEEKDPLPDKEKDQMACDGLRGTDEVEVPVVNGEYCKTALIGHAIMDADIFISLSHFKGHESTGFGGAIKNIGMGCGSRAGKMQQHASGKPAINEEVCRGCHRCAKECGSDAITYVNKKAVIDYDKCKGCGRCIGACSFDAVYNPNSSANELLDRKMAEYAQAVCHGRPHFHIALVQDISPNCDCHGENDAPILPDIGMFASFDPVALDQACADACLKATPIANSQLGEHLAEEGWHCHHDHFKDSNPNIEWKATLDQAEKIGLGTREYELKIIK